MPSLLLLEDDLLTATALRDGLVALGWTVRVEADGVSALRVIQADPPDAMIADLVLPGLDGLGVCAQVRLQPQGAGLPIVATSSRAEAEVAARAAGADGFLAKPVDPAAAHALLTSLVARRSLAHAVPVPEPLDAAGESESGALAPGWLPPLLRRLWRDRFTGALDVTGPSGFAARVYLQQGFPTASRSPDRATEFGEVLRSLGLAGDANLDAVVREGAGGGGPLTLGERLVHGGVLARAEVEKALREQVLQRTLAAARAEQGTWRLLPSGALGFAGFDVHPIAIEWRLGAQAPTLPGTGFRAARATAPVLTPEVWDCLDPAGAMVRVRSLLAAGAQVGEVLAEGPEAERLLGLVFAYGALRLTVDVAGVSFGEEAQQDVLAALVAEHRLLADANHYAVLGVGPGATDREVNAAAQGAMAALERASGIMFDGGSRQRIRDLQARVREAARVLGDSSRRGVYDALLDGPQLRSSARPVPEGAGAEELAEYGRQLLAAAKPVTALPVLARSLATADEDDPDVLALLGRARALACPGDVTAGEDLLRRALRLDPRCELALVYLGDQLAGAPGGAAEAHRCYRSALGHNPECAAASEGLRGLQAKVDR